MYGHGTTGACATCSSSPELSDSSKARLRRDGDPFFLGDGLFFLCARFDMEEHLNATFLRKRGAGVSFGMQGTEPESVVGTPADVMVVQWFANRANLYLSFATELRQAGLRVEL